LATLLHLGFKLSKAMRVQNLVEIRQYSAELKLLPVSENKRPPYWIRTNRRVIMIIIIPCKTSKVSKY